MNKFQFIFIFCLFGACCFGEINKDLYDYSIADIEFLDKEELLTCKLTLVNGYELLYKTPMTNTKTNQANLLQKHKDMLQIGNEIYISNRKYLNFDTHEVEITNANNLDDFCELDDYCEFEMDFTEKTHMLLPKFVGIFEKDDNIWDNYRYLKFSDGSCFKPYTQFIEHTNMDHWWTGDRFIISTFDNSTGDSTLVNIDLVTNETRTFDMSFGNLVDLDKEYIPYYRTLKSISVLPDTDSITGILILNDGIQLQIETKVSNNNKNEELFFDQFKSKIPINTRVVFNSNHQSTNDNALLATFIFDKETETSISLDLDEASKELLPTIDEIYSDIGLVSSLTYIVLSDGSKFCVYDGETDDWREGDKVLISLYGLDYLDSHRLINLDLLQSEEKTNYPTIRVKLA